MDKQAEAPLNSHVDGAIRDIVVALSLHVEPDHTIDAVVVHHHATRMTGTRTKRGAAEQTMNSTAAQNQATQGKKQAVHSVQTKLARGAEDSRACRSHR